MSENPLRLCDIDINKLSPMMQQYADMKQKLGDTILFYRLGDFYEMFFDDALYVSKTLELTLTARDCGSNLRAPMCGVPFHAFRTYANRLVSIGHKVAICEQLEDPSVAKGLVKRGIVKVLTPGTMTDTDGLEDKKNNYLMSVAFTTTKIGISVADVTTGDYYLTEVEDIRKLNDEITTGDFEATQLTSSENGDHLINLIGKYLPSEIIHNRAFIDSPEYKTILMGFQTSYTERNEREFASKAISDNKLIKVHGADKFRDTELVYGACSALIAYATETQTDNVNHLRDITCFKVSDTMELDLSTRVNLELTSTIRSKSKKGSLLWAIDRTKTAMGGRLLRKWIEEPLIVTSGINRRLDAVDEAMNKFIGRQEIIEGLTGLYDIERLAAKVSFGSINAREMLSLKNSLGKLPFLVKVCEDFSQGVFADIKKMLDPMEDIYNLLDKAIADDPPITIKDGDIIKRGYSAECDELHDITENANEFIQTIIKLKPATAKGTYIKSIYLSSTMSQGIKIDPKSAE